MAGSRAAAPIVAAIALDRFGPGGALGTLVVLALLNLVVVGLLWARIRREPRGTIRP
jgi:hypothetical protein